MAEVEASTASIVGAIIEWVNVQRAARSLPAVEEDGAASAATVGEAEAQAAASESIAAAFGGTYVSAGVTEELHSLITVTRGHADDAAPLAEAAMAQLAAALAADPAVAALLAAPATHAGVGAVAAGSAVVVVINLLQRFADVLEAGGVPVEAGSAALGEGSAGSSLAVAVLPRGGAVVTGARLVAASTAATELAVGYSLSSVALPAGEEGGAAGEATLRQPSPRLAEEVVWEGGAEAVSTGEDGAVLVAVPIPAEGGPFEVLFLGSLPRGGAGGEGEGKEGEGEAPPPATLARLFLSTPGGEREVHGHSHAGGEEGAGEGVTMGSAVGHITLAPAALAGLELLPPTTPAMADGFSEVALLSSARAVGSDEDVGALLTPPPSFFSLSVPVRPSPHALPLPFVLAVASSAALPRVSQMLLVGGSTLEEAHESCPEGFDLVPLDIAQDAAALAGAGAGAARGLAAHPAEGEEGAPAPEAEAPPSLLHSEPAHAYLAVFRGGAPLVHASLSVLVTVAHEALPAVEAPPGYALQVLDVALRQPGVDGEVGMPLILRIVLVQTGEGEAAAAVAAGGACVTLHAPSSATAEEGEGAAASASSLEGGLALVTLSDMGAGGGYSSYEEEGEGREGQGEVEEGEGEVEEEVDEEALAVEREELLGQIRAAREEEAALTAARDSTHAILAAWFAIRSANEEDAAGAQPPAVATNDRAAAAQAYAMIDKERRLAASVAAFTAEREAAEEARLRAEGTALRLQEGVDAKETVLGDIRAAFATFKREIARGALHGQTGKPIPRPLLDKYEQAEAVKEDELSRVQLRYLAAASAAHKLEAALAARDKVADGLALMDFEQLAIENATLAEKAEERSNEIARLRKKTTGAVQVLSHVREKLTFVAAEVARLSVELGSVDADLTTQRLELAAGKKDRERARQNNDSARAAQGFAYVDRLAIDYERRKREILESKDALAEQQATYGSAQARVLATQSALTSAARAVYPR